MITIFHLFIISLILIQEFKYVIAAPSAVESSILLTEASAEKLKVFMADIKSSGCQDDIIDFYINQLNFPKVEIMKPTQLKKTSSKDCLDRFYNIPIQKLKENPNSLTVSIDKVYPHGSIGLFYNIGIRNKLDDIYNAELSHRNDVINELSDSKFTLVPTSIYPNVISEYVLLYYEIPTGEYDFKSTGIINFNDYFKKYLVPRYKEYAFAILFDLADIILTLWRKDYAITSSLEECFIVADNTSSPELLDYKLYLLSSAKCIQRISSPMYTEFYEDSFFLKYRYKTTKDFFSYVAAIIEKPELEDRIAVRYKTDLTYVTKNEPNDEYEYDEMIRKFNSNTLIRYVIQSNGLKLKNPNKNLTISKELLYDVVSFDYDIDTIAGNILSGLNVFTSDFDEITKKGMNGVGKMKCESIPYSNKVEAYNILLNIYTIEEALKNSNIESFVLPTFSYMNIVYKKVILCYEHSDEESFSTMPLNSNLENVKELVSNVFKIISSENLALYVNPPDLRLPISLKSDNSIKYLLNLPSFDINRRSTGSNKEEEKRSWAYFALATYFVSRGFVQSEIELAMVFQRLEHDKYATFTSFLSFILSGIENEVEQAFFNEFIKIFSEKTFDSFNFDSILNHPFWNINSNELFDGRKALFNPKLTFTYENDTLNELVVKNYSLPAEDLPPLLFRKRINYKFTPICSLYSIIFDLEYAAEVIERSNVLFSKADLFVYSFKSAISDENQLSIELCVPADNPIPSVYLQDLYADYESMLGLLNLVYLAEEARRAGLHLFSSMEGNIIVMLNDRDDSLEDIFTDINPELFGRDLDMYSAFKLLSFVGRAQFKLDMPDIFATESPLAEFWIQWSENSESIVTDIFHCLNSLVDVDKANDINIEKSKCSVYGKKLVKDLVDLGHSQSSHIPIPEFEFEEIEEFAGINVLYDASSSKINSISTAPRRFSSVEKLFQQAYIKQ